MKILKYCPEILLILLAAACVAAALSAPQDTSSVKLLCSPFVLAGDAIKRIYNGGNRAGAWCLYIFIGILPLAVPCAICAAKRKFFLRSALWLLLSACTFFVLYAVMNTQLFAFEIFPLSPQSEEQYYSLITNAVCFIWLSVAVLCVLSECNCLLKNRKSSAYTLAQVFLYLIAAIYIADAFYISLSCAAYNYSLLNRDILSGADWALNVLSLIMPAAVNCLSGAAAVVFLAMTARLAGRLKTDSLSAQSLKDLKKLGVMGRISISVTLILALVSNVAVLAVSKRILTMYFSVRLPLFTVVSVCLVTIAVEIMKRAIAADEENKLTI